MTISIGMVSLGCPKNLVDGESMLGLLEEDGFILTSEPSTAEVIIVNTCGFIESAKEESIQAVLQMASYKKEAHCKALILTGCLGERYADELFVEMPEVDAIVGSHGWGKIIEVIRRVLLGERFIFKPQAATQIEKTARKLSTGSYSAYLKIAEGCNNACSYCIIPKLRGPYTSKPVRLVLEEAQELAAAGIKEIIVVAQDVTRYGEDFSGKLLLPELLIKLAQIPGIEWIRIMYAYPQYITDELIETIAGQKKICKYIDIPLQHANDSILRRMNRKDRKVDIISLLTKLRAKIPDIAIRTTFIVGFPGEMEKEYAELKEFLCEQKFANVGIFAYSQEEDTPAAQMPQVNDTVKEERYNELMALQAAISETNNVALEGKEITVLVETTRQTEDGLVVTARSYREAPEIDGTVYLENAESCQPGMLVKAKVLQGFAYDFLAGVI